MKRTLYLAACLSAAVFGFDPTSAIGSDKGHHVHQKGHDHAHHVCDAKCPAYGGHVATAHGFHLRGGPGGHAHGHGHGHGVPGGVLPALAAGLHGGGVGLYGGGRANNGLPLFDRYMRADWIAANQAATRSWHAGYYHTQWGMPLAYVVPPTARMQTRMGWGVNQSTMLPIYHQFERPYPNAVLDASGGMATNPLRPTPRWPSHTDQFGVYYVRGPW